jgi:hypothetical protein
MNLGEILRAAGYEIPGPTPEHDQIVSSFASKLSGVPNDDREIIGALYTKLVDHYGDKAARWIVRDAFDRAVIRADLQAASQSFFGTKPSTSALQ